MRVYSYGHIKPLYCFCHGCGAILEFNSKESKMSKYYLAYGPQDDGRDYFITCPVCGRIIYDRDFKASPDDC